jgi:hypothetical protein
MQTCKKSKVEITFEIPNCPSCDSEGHLIELKRSTGEFVALVACTNNKGICKFRKYFVAVGYTEKSVVTNPPVQIDEKAAVGQQEVVQKPFQFIRDPAPSQPSQIKTPFAFGQSGN